MNWFYLLGGVIGVYASYRILMQFNAVNNSNSPRGIRNNNPLNIRYSSANQWEGMKGSDGAFCVFESPEMGIRAAGVLLKNYINVHKCDSIIKIISRWAPDNENNTSSYIKFVSSESGISADKRITQDQIYKIIRPMIKMENGIQPYTDGTIRGGLARAGL